MFEKLLAKKYYSTNEATKFLNIFPYQLRYLEANILNLSGYKIKNRKYYTNDDIKLLEDYIANNKKIPIKQNIQQISYRIDMLIKNFNILATDITEFLATQTKILL
ncbi:hypothetical protein [Rickettsia endosymbiont of Halotydeus destructor]|uniref:hypothetical protein n=1 Tax=Rickettsia endosymbiont of Halotydeus destructor TaxID=2996754 RepID=UPI003BAEDA44